MTNYAKQNLQSVILARYRSAYLWDINHIEALFQILKLQIDIFIQNFVYYQINTIFVRIVAHYCGSKQNSK